MIEPRFDSTEELYTFAQQYLPAGIGAAGRFHSSLRRPTYFRRGEGAYIWGVDGKKYLDLNISFGATILGHNHPKIRQAIVQALDMGIIACCETEYVSRLAEKVCQTIPCAEMVRFATSGQEANALMIRLARAATGRERIIKFEGHYHGLNNDVMFNTAGAAWQGPAPIPPRPDSAGMPRAAADLVIVLPWNDYDAIEQAFARHGDEIAGVICEPINYDSGCIPADPDYLQAVRALTRRHGSLLLYDEVLSAFRTGPSCAQGYYGILPDLCTVAKAIANGVPIALVCGRRDLLMLCTPSGPVLHTGTYTDHNFGVLAGLACLEELTKPGFYEPLLSTSDRFYRGFSDLLAKHGIPGRLQGVGCRFGIFFGVSDEVTGYRQAVGRDVPLWHRFVLGCLERGVYIQSIGHALGHSGFSAAHTPADIDWALDRIDDVCAHLRKEG